MAFLENTNFNVNNEKSFWKCLLHARVVVIFFVKFELLYNVIKGDRFCCDSCDDFWIFFLNMIHPLIFENAKSMFIVYGKTWLFLQRGEVQKQLWSIQDLSQQFAPSVAPMGMALPGLGENDPFMRRGFFWLVEGWSFPPRGLKCWPRGCWRVWVCCPMSWWLWESLLGPVGNVGLYWH